MIRRRLLLPASPASPTCPPLPLLLPLPSGEGQLRLIVVLGQLQEGVVDQEGHRIDREGSDQRRAEAAEQATDALEGEGTQTTPTKVRKASVCCRDKHELVSLRPVRGRRTCSRRMRRVTNRAVVSRGSVWMGLP